VSIVAIDLIYSWHPSPSYSPGSVGSRPTRLCLHTTEGATTNPNICGFLQGHNGVSYHASVDNVSRTCYEYVYETDGAWAQCNANSTTVCLVMCTPSGASAGWSSDYWWNNQRKMMENAAQWLADQHRQYPHIPLVALNNSQAQSGVHGVCEHQNLQSWGCSHSDCGAMPMDKLLDLAKSYLPGATAPPQQPPTKPPTRHGEDYDGMQLVFGRDGKCAVEMPKDVTHFRIGCSQGTEINVQWVGKSDPVRTYDLNDYRRVDVPTPTGATVNADATGQAVLYDHQWDGPHPDPGTSEYAAWLVALAPVSFAWIAK
jgi:hypothetical protein